MCVKLAESNESLDGRDEDKSEDDANSLQEDDDRVYLNVVDLLPEAVLQLVRIDEEVPAEQARDAETEQEAFDVDCGLSN